MPDRTEVRVGLFVVLALAILGVGTLLIVGLQPFGVRHADYQVLMRSSGGVRRGDPIRVSGIEVGRVQRIHLSPGEEWPVRFAVSVKEEIVLTEGSSARITADGLLGAPYLEIEPGPVDARALPPGSTIRGRQVGDLDQALSRVDELAVGATALLEQISAVVAGVSEQIGPLLERVQVLLSEENTESIQATLTSLETTLKDAGPRLTSLLERLDSVAGRLDEGAAGLPELTKDLSTLASSLETALGPEGERLADVLEAAEETLGSAGGAFSVVEGNRAELDATLRDLRDAAANLKSLTQALKERPGLLLRRSPPPDGKLEEQ